MRKEIIQTAKTVDTAIDMACEALGCDRDQCEWEIIDLPKKGFLGLRNTPAKVKVSFATPEEELPPTPAPPPAAPAKVAKPKVDAPKADAPKPAPKRAPQPAKAAAPDPQPVAPKAAQPAGDTAEAKVPVDIAEKEQAAVQYLQDILRDMELQAQLAVTRESEGLHIAITGEKLGAIIGRRGETLDAIQSLTGLVVNRLGGDYLRVTVDCGSYRVKRKETLEALARKLAAQVLSTDVSKTLEPMNPFERRIIHATISEIEGVSSSSVGEEPNRRVVITTPTARQSGYRSSRRPGSSDHRSGGSRGGRRNGGSGYNKGERPKRPPRAVAEEAPNDQPPKQTPEALNTSGQALYTKIELD